MDIDEFQNSSFDLVQLRKSQNFNETEIKKMF